ncbi:8-amino-7-oxononanoate synthase [Photobacterium sanctipauli]|uniref:8-amino-7-oxononanoate synthase n=1 Tax=Photobacterium sanctipauli TaxID=1342794 RepID=A0A2T3NY62_9GAMM|nr:8-amino-7-oxononanoate synthase [Photobacterium sanctipauli]PSW21225.1 8-amino-7-oxononanoate synthase [Photobacterium sanctipauli]
MHRFNQRISNALAERDQQGLYRQRTCLERQSDHESERVRSEDGAYLNFSSNDYLGLAQSPELIQAWQEGLSLYGAGSGASPLVTGYHRPHANVEAQLAEWLGFDRALLFSSGFSANQAVLFALLQCGDSLFQDKLNHASLIEAGMLSEANMRRFAHNDVSSLSRLLNKNSDSGSVNFVATEGVFSMDGDLSPLAEISAACHQAESVLLVDDAHGCGVLGHDGKGSCELAGVQPDILVVTFGKAFGLQGAAVLCSQDTAEYLVQFARHYVYSTAMPPAQAHALSTACRMIQSDGWRRERLGELSQTLVEGLDYGIGFDDTPSPIKPLMVGKSDEALRISHALRQRGIWVSAIRPPTVPVNSARLRITLTAAHQPDDIKQLSMAINEVFHGE